MNKACNDQYCDHHTRYHDHCSMASGQPVLVHVFSTIERLVQVLSGGKRDETLGPIELTENKKYTQTLNNKFKDSFIVV